MNNDNVVVRAQATVTLIRLVKMDKDELVSCVSTLTQAIGMMSGDIRTTYEIWFDFWKKGKFVVTVNEFPKQDRGGESLTHHCVSPSAVQALTLVSSLPLLENITLY